MAVSWLLSNGTKTWVKSKCIMYYNNATVLSIFDRGHSQTNGVTASKVIDVTLAVLLFSIWYFFKWEPWPMCLNITLWFSLILIPPLYNIHSICIDTIYHKHYNECRVCYSLNEISWEESRRNSIVRTLKILASKPFWNPASSTHI